MTTQKAVLKEEIKQELRDEAKEPFVPHWLQKLFWIFLAVLMILVLLWALPRVFPAVSSWKLFSVNQPQPAVVVAPATKPQPVSQPAVNPQEPAPAAEPVVIQPATGPVSEATLITFGDLGTYKVVYDTNRKQWTIGQWNENMVQAGKMNLADLKRDGGQIKFVMPANGWINNSAGQLFVDGKQWNLGKYGEIGRMTKETLILKDQVIMVQYEPANDSAGFQIWFEN